MTDQSSFQASSTWLMDSLSPNAPITPSSTLNPLTSIKRERFLLPNHPSERAKAVVYCSRIDHVRIRETEKIEGNTYYTIEIFYKRKLNNIPTAQRLLGLEILEIASPDAIKYQRFSMFARLRHELSYHASVGHGTRPCKFCAEMTQLVNTGPTIPRLSLKLFHGQDTVSHALERFLNEVLMIANSHLVPLPQSKLCEGQQDIPVLLERFLTRESEEVATHFGHVRRGKETRRL